MTGHKLVRQPHGGALLAGGVPGNRGGAGRPRSEVRRVALEGADVAVERLRMIVEGKRSSPRNVIAAAGLLLKYGLGPDHEITRDQLHQFLRLVRTVIEEECDAETAERVVARIRRIPTP